MDNLHGEQSKQSNQADQSRSASSVSRRGGAHAANSSMPKRSQKAASQVAPSAQSSVSHSDGLDSGSSTSAFASASSAGTAKAGRAKHSRGRSQEPYDSTQTFENYSRAYYGQQVNKKSPRNRHKRRVWTVVLVLAILVLAVCLVLLGLIAWSYYSSDKMYDEIADEAQVVTEANALEEMTVDWDALLAQNPDTVAWIYMPGTKINYPVVQGEDDEEYLHTDFEGNYNTVTSPGTIFLSVENNSDFSDDNNFLYGHRKNDLSMFGLLMYMQDQDTFDETRTVYILTPTRNYRCTTLALDIVPKTGTSIIETNFLDAATMASYLQDRIDESSAKADDVDLGSISKVFTLISCGDVNADTRAVLFTGVVESAVPSNAEVSEDSESDDSTSEDASAQAEEADQTEEVDQAA